MNKEDWSRTDWVGFIISNLIVFTSLITVGWFIVMSSTFDLVYNTLIEMNPFLAIIFLLGFIPIANFLGFIAELFTPETKEDREVRKKKIEFKNKYPIKIARLKGKALRLEFKLKEINDEIKEEQK